ELRKPGWNSSVTAAPPSTLRRSSTRTERPAPARYAAHVRPLCPPPMMTASRPPFARRTATSVFVQAGGNGREAVVHVGDLAGDSAREVRQQEGGDVADFLRGHVASHRRVGFDEALDLREATDAR